MPPPRVVPQDVPWGEALGATTLCRPTQQAPFEPHPSRR